MCYSFMTQTQIQSHRLALEIIKGEKTPPKKNKASRPSARRPARDVNSLALRLHVASKTNSLHDWESLGGGGGPGTRTTRADDVPVLLGSTIYGLHVPTNDVRPRVLRGSVLRSTAREGKGDREKPPGESQGRGQPGRRSGTNTNRLNARGSVMLFTLGSAGRPRRRLSA